MDPARKRWTTEGLEVGPDRTAMSPMDFPPPIPPECRSSNDSIVFLGAPPIADESSLRQVVSESERSQLSFPVDRLQIRPRDRDLGGRQKSAGWLGSVLLHLGIVILVAFLFAPADFGGVSTQTLILTLSDETPEIPIPMMLVDEVASEDTSLRSEDEPKPVEVDSMDVSFEIGRPTIQVGGTKTNSGRSTGNVGGGARGSFFGIEAVGHEFVYIVDRSGSMNGNRYRRAIEELKRSVDDLREDQRFFVVLFSSNSTPMLGQPGQGARMLHATKENKEKLHDWLATIGPGGGTNPNSSLRTALKMNPSAVFMLSDGEFTESKTRRRGGILQAGGSAYSIVEATGGSIPIHAIAFEDPRSCRNMKRLSEVSGGEYRFVNSSGKTRAQLLAEAKDLMSQPASKSRNRARNSLCREFGDSQVTASGKRVFAKLLLDEYESAFGKIKQRKPDDKDPDLDETLRLLESLIAIDSNRNACADLQDQVAGQLSWLLSATDEKAVVECVCDKVIRWPQSPATVNVLDRLVDHFVSLNQDEPEKAFMRLRMIKRLHPQSKAVAACQAVCDGIIDEVIGQANQFLENGDLASAVKTLRTAQSNEQISAVRTVTRKALYDLTMEQLIAARDASIRHDTDAKDKINEQLANGFGDDPLLEQCRKELVSRELTARRLLQQVEHGNAYSGLKLKRQQLEEIVQRFPEAIAAKKANEQLALFPKWEAARDKEHAELIRMMDDTRRQ
jgi:hypothetical protein